MFSSTLFDLLGGNFSGFDAWQDEDILHLEIALPGYEKGNIKVFAEDQVISIEATREHKTTSRSFSKRFLIPEGYDKEKSNVEYENGLLSISIPKLEEKKRKRIDIK